MSAILNHTHLIAPTAIIHHTARIGKNVEIGPGAIIEAHVVIGDNCEIGAHAIIHSGTTMGAHNRVSAGAILGQVPQDLKYQGEDTTLVIGDHNQIREYVTISRGTAGGGGVTRIGSHNLFMATVHIGHDCQIGDRVIIANGSGLAGHCVVEDGVVIGGMSGLHQFTRIGRQAMVSGFSKVTADVPPFAMADGAPARFRGINIVGMRRSGMSAPDRMEIQRAYRVLYRSGLNRSAAVEKLVAGGEPGEQLAHLIQFVQAAERGIIRASKEAAE